MPGIDGLHINLDTQTDFPLPDFGMMTAEMIAPGPKSPESDPGQATHLITCLYIRIDTPTSCLRNFELGDTCKSSPADT